MEQRSNEWFLARLGKLTASNMDIAAKVLKNGNESEQRYGLKLKILAERLTETSKQKYTSASMDWGTATEKECFDLLNQSGYDFLETGFIEHQTISNFGASPDGISVCGKIGLEIKCPDSHTHARYLLDGVVPEQYKQQMIAQAVCAGFDSVLFCSYDPRYVMPHLRTFTVMFTPTIEERKKCENDAVKFLDDVRKLELKLTF